ncbi:MAG: hypothetical protein CMJ19_23365 [Phycisphaeraceae bacterium]|nr:hypothetical protein [Phycisphaeraceae bacterium]
MRLITILLLFYNPQLANGDMTLQSGQMYPNGCRSISSGVKASTLTENQPDGVSSGLRIVPETKQQWLGFITQTVKISLEKVPCHCR